MAPALHRLMINSNVPKQIHGYLCSVRAGFSHMITFAEDGLGAARSARCVPLSAQTTRRTLDVTRFDTKNIYLHDILSMGSTLAALTKAFKRIDCKRSSVDELAMSTPIASTATNASSQT